MDSNKCGYPLDNLNLPDDYNEILLKILSLRNNTATVINDVPVFMTTSSNQRYSYLDPRAGASIAVAEASRSIACYGSRPQAAAYCLNLANPQDPEARWALQQSIEGLVEAGQVLEIPFAEGKVTSFSIPGVNPSLPVPTISMVGMKEREGKNLSSLQVQEEGDIIFLIGETLPEIGGSLYLKVNYNLVEGKPPVLNLKLEKSVQKTIKNCITEGLIKSAIPCAEGGLAKALVASCMKGDMGAEVLMVRRFRGDALLFGESQSRVVVTVGGDKALELVKKLVDDEVPYTQLGKTGGPSLTINVVNPGCTGCGGNLVDLPMAKIKETWRGAMDCLIK